MTHTHTHTHTRLTALFLGLPGWAGTRKVKPIWTLLEQETVSGSGISWAICKSAPRSRQITTPASHHSVFYRPDALPAAQPTVSKHWRPKWQSKWHNVAIYNKHKTKSMGAKYNSLWIGFIIEWCLEYASRKHNFVLCGRVVSVYCGRWHAPTIHKPQSQSLINERQYRISF